MLGSIVQKTIEGLIWVAEGWQHVLEQARSDPMIFVVHGRNARLRAGLCAYLRALGLDPKEWTTLVGEQGTGTPYIGDLLDNVFGRKAIIIVLMTPDEDVRLVGEVEGDDPEPGRQPRPNVILEMGRAQERDARRLVIVEVGEIRPISDLSGLNAVRFTGSDDADKAARMNLALRLKGLGCHVRIDRTDWQTAGDLRPEASLQLASVSEAAPAQVSRIRRASRRRQWPGVPLEPAGHPSSEQAAQVPA